MVHLYIIASDLHHSATLDPKIEYNIIKEKFIFFFQCFLLLQNNFKVQLRMSQLVKQEQNLLVQHSSAIFRMKTHVASCLKAVFHYICNYEGRNMTLCDSANVLEYVCSSRAQQLQEWFRGNSEIITYFHPRLDKQWLYTALRGRRQYMVKFTVSTQHKHPACLDLSGERRFSVKIGFTYLLQLCEDTHLKFSYSHRVPRQNIHEHIRNIAIYKYNSQ